MKGVDDLALPESRSQQRSRGQFELPDYIGLDGITVTPRKRWYPVAKNVIEAGLALVGLLILGPTILVAAFAVRITSRGPAFYLQKRLGQGGRVFTMIKIRTMVHNAEAGTGPVWATTDDPRVTPLGQFLRKTQIDEFPQLINVLLGHMSLVGPRPERPEIADRLELDVPGYSQRLRVKPGITGLAQLSLPADTDLESVRRKLVHDLYYVRHIGPWLDTRILVFTGIYFVQSVMRVVWSLISLPTLPVAQEALMRETDEEFAQSLTKTA